MSRDQVVGLTIFAACVIIAVLYAVGLFLPTFEGFRFWLVAIPVCIGLVVILAISQKIFKAANNSKLITKIIRKLFS